MPSKCGGRTRLPLGLDASAAVLKSIDVRGQEAADKEDYENVGFESSNGAQCQEERLYNSWIDNSMQCEEWKLDN